MAIVAVRKMSMIPDLRKRIVFVLGLLAVYRFGALFPTPGIDADQLQLIFHQMSHQYPGTAFWLLDLFSGGNLRSLTVFALGIMPYIAALIVIQLLAAVGAFRRTLAREGGCDLRKVGSCTRYLALVIALGQAFGIAYALWSQGEVVRMPGWQFIPMTMLTLTTGSALVIWLAEQITARGIGNGPSLIVLAGIIASSPHAVGYTVDKLRAGEWSPLLLLFLIAAMISAVMFMVRVELARRRIPVQFTKPGDQGIATTEQLSRLELRLNVCGVLPVIFAVSAVACYQMFGMTGDNPALNWMSENLGLGDPLGDLLYIGGITFFYHSCASVVANPDKIVGNIRRYGGVIPGVPEEQTAKYLVQAVKRSTLVGAVYLSSLAIVATVYDYGFHLRKLPLIGAIIEAPLPTFNGFTEAFPPFATALLLIVGLTMEAIHGAESQALVRYEREPAGIASSNPVEERQGDGRA